MENSPGRREGEEELKREREKQEEEKLVPEHKSSEPLLKQ
jgi:hypothetical protein